jgi:drug/metabolite transporter (DMT)-like permease
MLLATSTHLLLQGTAILWTVAAAVLINRERVGRYGLATCLLCFLQTQ